MDNSLLLNSPAQRDFFKESLYSGNFSIINELIAPLRSQGLHLVASRIEKGLKITSISEDCAGDMLLDRFKGENSYELEEVVPFVSRFSQKLPIVVISGKAATESQVLSRVGALYNIGIRHFTFVTGNRLDEHLNSNEHNIGYLDSLRLIEVVRKQFPEVIIGVGVNQFKYTPDESLTQYFKLQRKIQRGADIIYTQFGWDMAKFQELRWYLQENNINIPVIARAMLPSKDVISNYGSCIMPGLHVSRRFKSMLQREYQNGTNNFLAVNIYRIALIAAGCKLLGYRGISVNYLNHDEEVRKMTISRIAEALKNYRTWGDWLDAWNELNSNLNFAPDGCNFYLYENLLKAEVFEFNYALSTKVKYEVEKIKWRRKLRYHCSSFFQIDKGQGPLRSALKMLMYKSLSCDSRLAYLPADKCPKRLVHGPCGGSVPGGECEFQHGACLFSRHFAFLHWLNKIDSLEE
ncbi:MAG: methylenetetrahydrofolate reductase C-terminal domain-containing protein [Lentisphaeria bacterium]